MYNYCEKQKSQIREIILHLLCVILFATEKQAMIHSQLSNR